MVDNQFIAARIMNRELVKERLGGRLVVPSHPKVIEKIRARMESDRVSLPEIGQLIATDPPLTARILRAVNNSHHVLATPVLSTVHAASILGQRGLKNLMLRTVTVDRPMSLSASGFDGPSLWRHSIFVGALSEQLSKVARADLEPDECGLYGLLHDLGKFVFFEQLQDEYVELLVRERDGNESIDRLEHRAFGFSHNELGAMLMKRWSLPDALVLTARFHHNEKGIAELDPRVATVYVANLVAEAVEHGRTKDVDAQIAPGALELLGLDDERLKDFVEFAKQRLPTIVV